MYFRQWQHLLSRQRLLGPAGRGGRCVCGARRAAMGGAGHPGHRPAPACMRARIGRRRGLEKRASSGRRKRQWAWCMWGNGRSFTRLSGQAGARGGPLDVRLPVPHARSAAAARHCRAEAGAVAPWSHRHGGRGAAPAAAMPAAPRDQARYRRVLPLWRLPQGLPPPCKIKKMKKKKNKKKKKKEEEEEEEEDKEGDEENNKKI
mgnify:CR=1 FL=1